MISQLSASSKLCFYSGKQSCSVCKVRNWQNWNQNSMIGTHLPGKHRIDSVDPSVSDVFGVFPSFFLIFRKDFSDNSHNRNTNSQSSIQTQKSIHHLFRHWTLMLWRFISFTEAFKTNFSNKVYWCEISSNEKSRLINHVYLSSIHKKINQEIFYLFI